MVYSRFSLVFYFIHSFNLNLPAHPMPPFLVGIHTFFLYVWVFIVFFVIGVQLLYNVE